MTNTELILASASPARTKLLTDAGIRHSVLVSDVDEEAVTREHGVTDPAETALLLARAKCEAVAGLEAATGSFVLGCDSVFEFNGEPYGKPYTAAAARERILQMRGNSGTLHTGHWLIDARNTGDGGTETAMGAVASATVHFADMTDDEVDAYVATGEPLNVAGSFTIDSLGGAFITGVEGDAHAIVGLSVATLRGLLMQTGTAITAFWR